MASMSRSTSTAGASTGACIWAPEPPTEAGSPPTPGSGRPLATSAGGGGYVGGGDAGGEGAENRGVETVRPAGGDGVGRAAPAAWRRTRRGAMGGSVGVPPPEAGRRTSGTGASELARRRIRSNRGTSPPADRETRPAGRRVLAAPAVADHDAPA